MAEKINKYKTLELLGKGAFGKVYRGVDVASKRPVAIKVVSLKNISVGVLKQNMNEVTMLSSIKSRYVCGFVDAFIEYTQSELWMVLEYCDEGNISSLIDKFIEEKTRVPEKTVWKYLIQTAIALRTIHRYQIVHRDIKPSNLLLSGPDKTIKVSDFNVSELLGSASSSVIVGTPSYIAPEVWRNTRYTFACDVFALGCIIYELMALKTAFYRDDVNELRDLIIQKHPDKMGDGYSQELKNLIFSCLTKDPERRITLSKLLQLPVVVEWAKELGLSLQDVESGYYGLNRVTLEIGKTYPHGKDGNFHNSLVHTLCNFEFKEVISEEKRASRSRPSAKPQARGSRELDPNLMVKGSDKLCLPIKKIEKAELLDRSMNSGVPPLPLKWFPSRKESARIWTPTGSMKDLNKSIENTVPPEKLDDRDTMSETKLKLLLKMQLRITEAFVGEKKTVEVPKKSLSAVPNEKFRQKINEFSKKMMSRKPSPNAGPNLAKRNTHQDFSEALHAAPQQVRLKTVRSDIKLTPKPSIVLPGEPGLLDKASTKKNPMAKRI